jgi:TetR/AcrR family transcriptional regulator
VAKNNPDRDESEATRRDRVLAAAIDEFAQHGLAGARVDRISDRAKVNKQLIYYYFEDKAGLFDAAVKHLATAFNRVRSTLPPAPAQRMAAYFDGATQDQSIIRMLLWEALEHEPGEPWLEHDGRSAHMQLAVERLREEQRQGAIPYELDAAQLFLSFQALASHPYAFPQMTQFITGMDASSDEFVTARKAFLLALGHRLFPEAASAP